VFDGIDKIGLDNSSSFCMLVTTNKCGMECNTQFWLWGLLSLSAGALGAWLWMRQLLNDLSQKRDKDLNKIISLENEYAQLRSTTQSQILDLETKNAENHKLADLPELNSEYDSLKVEYDSLLSKYHELERLKSQGSDIDSGLIKEKDSVITELESENKRLVKKLKSITDSKIKVKSSNLKSLKDEVKSLKTKLKKEKKAQGIEKRVEIVKSIRKKKLKDWLNKDKSYKVKKKVSTRELKK